jgi:hypothetical protein
MIGETEVVVTVPAVVAEDLARPTIVTADPAAMSLTSTPIHPAAVIRTENARTDTPVVVEESSDDLRENGTATGALADAMEVVVETIPVADLIGEELEAAISLRTDVEEAEMEADGEMIWTKKLGRGPSRRRHPRSANPPPT